MENQVEISLLNESVVDCHTAQSSACFAKSSEDECMEEKQDFQKEQVATLSMEKDANLKVLSNVSENCDERKKMYGCPLCLERFAVPSKLKRHCLTHTNQRPFQCPICCHRFRERSHLKVHISTHTNPAKQRKPLLHRHGFSHQASLTAQSDANSTDEQNSVTADLNKTNSESGLNIMKGHWCPLCLKCFKTQSKLKRHILIHAEQKPFKCFLCSKNFWQRSHLKVHKCKGKTRPGCKSILRGRLVGENRVVRNKEVGFAVRIQPASRSSNTCVLQFKRKSGYQCDTCFEVFSAPSKLKRHQLIHMDSQRYTCKICRKSFKQACNLQKHLELHKGKRHCSSGMCDVKEENGGSSSTHGAPDGSNSREPNAENLSLPQISHSEDSQNYEMLQCDIHFNQNVPLTTSGDVEIESADTTEEPIADSSQTSLTYTSKGANQCIICLKTFQYPYSLSRHLLTHTDVKPFRCRVCLKSFRNLYHLKRHKKIHQKPSKKMLPPFSNSSNVKKKSGHQCEICLKIFRVPSELAQHQFVHADTKPFTCRICGRSFIHASSLKKHLKLHEDKRSNPSQLQGMHSNNCGRNDVYESLPLDTQTNEMLQCHSRPTQNVSLTVPKLINVKIESADPLEDTEEQIADSNPTDLEHTSNFVHQCRICLKKFLYPSRLSRHLLSHTDVRPFKCSVCLKTFRNKYHLRRHKKTHKHPANYKPLRLGEVPRENKASSSTHGASDGSSNYRPKRGNVSLPQILDSVGTKYYEPRECGSHLDQNVLLTESESVNSLGDSEEQTATSSSAFDMDNSKSANQCSICLKTFPYPSKLTRHLLTHTEVKPFNCSVCSKSFRNQSKLQNHQRFHRKNSRKRFAQFSNSVYQCEICLKKFNFPSKLKRHLSVHSDAKPYSCTFCGKSFRLAEYLTEHLKIHTPKRNTSRDSSTLRSLRSANNNGMADDISGSVDTQTNESFSLTTMDDSSGTESQTANSSPTNLKGKSEGVNQCVICLKTFPCHSKLFKHLLSHADFIPLKCNVCWKSFRYQHNLESHQKIHQQISHEVIAADLEQDSGNTVTSKDQDLKIPSKAVATVHQDQNVLPDNVLSPEISGDCSDSGGMSSNGTSFLGNTAVSSEFASNKSVWGLTHNTNISALAEKKAPDMVPFGRVSDCPPKSESSLQHCSSEVRTEETWPGNIKEELSFVDSDTIKHVPDSSIPPSCLYPQKVADPNLGEPDVLKHLNFQDPDELQHEPQHDFLICSDCGQSFPTELEFYAHKCTKSDTNEKTKKFHQCDICFKVFNVPSKLKRHSVTHTGKKPFQCPHCEKSFTQSHHMKTHMLTHGFEPLPQGLSGSL